MPDAFLVTILMLAVAVAAWHASKRGALVILVPLEPRISTDLGS